MHKKYSFKPYNPQFPILFSLEAKKLQKSLPKDALIEHVGSTAIAGLGGKGIIDIAIGAVKEKRELIISILTDLGYEFQPRLSSEDRAFFKAQKPDSEEGIRTYHIHLMDPKNQQWLDMLFFRDYLGKFPEEMRRYAALKEKAALDAQGQGEIYRKCKEPFLQEILDRRNSVLSGD